MAIPYNAPSIPSHHNVFGYEENFKGDLIRQTNEFIAFTRNGEIKPAPG